MRLSAAILVALAAPVGCQAPSSDRPTSPGGKADDPNAGGERAEIGSREYKLLLDPGPFAGSDPEAAVRDWWEAASIDLPDDLELKGDAIALDKERDVVFLDVPGSCSLHANDLVLRHRVKLSNDETQLTLKYRSVDRFLAAAADVGTSEDEFKHKFEEDIVPPHASKYSRSTSIEGVDEPWTIGEAADLFPVLSKVDDADTELEAVGDLVVFERKYDGPEIDLGKIEADLAVTLWYRDAAADEPFVAEVSFDYKAHDEVGFELKSVRNGLLFFEHLKRAPGLATEGLTKTASVYAEDPGFCD